MDDQTLQQNYYEACIYYMEQNGGLGDRSPSSLFVLRQKQDKVQIDSWLHESKQPIDTQLKAYSVDDLTAARRRREAIRRISQQSFPKLTTAERNALGAVPESSTIWNTTTKKVEIYANGAWHALAYEA